MKWVELVSFFCGSEVAVSLLKSERPESLPSGCDHEVLNNGATGPCVLWVQHYLNRYQGGKLSPDGLYGKNTKTAVANFQTSRGLPHDGVVGPNTWMLMLGRSHPL